jgi:hypothetical protein
MTRRKEVCVAISRADWLIVNTAAVTVRIAVQIVNLKVKNEIRFRFGAIPIICDILGGRHGVKQTTAFSAFGSEKFCMTARFGS